MVDEICHSTISCSLLQLYFLPFSLYSANWCIMRDNSKYNLTDQAEMLWFKLYFGFENFQTSFIFWPRQTHSTTSNTVESNCVVRWWTRWCLLHNGNTELFLFARAHEKLPEFCDKTMVFGEKLAQRKIVICEICSCRWVVIEYLSLIFFPEF